MSPGDHQDVWEAQVSDDISRWAVPPDALLPRPANRHQDRTTEEEPLPLQTSTLSHQEAFHPPSPGQQVSTPGYHNDVWRKPAETSTRTPSRRQGHMIRRVPPSSPRRSPSGRDHFLCLECGTDASNVSAHYPTHVRCLLCCYSSCCSRAYAAHMIQSVLQYYYSNTTVILQ